MLEFATNNLHDWNTAIETGKEHENGYLYLSKKQSKVAVLTQEELKDRKNDGYHRLSMIEIVKRISKLKSQVETPEISQRAKENLRFMANKHDENINKKYGAFAFVIRIFECLSRIFGDFCTTTQAANAYIDNLKVKESVPTPAPTNGPIPSPIPEQEEPAPVPDAPAAPLENPLPTLVTEAAAPIYTTSPLENPSLTENPLEAEQEEPILVSTVHEPVSNEIPAELEEKAIEVLALLNDILPNSCTFLRPACGQFDVYSNSTTSRISGRIEGMLMLINLTIRHFGEQEIPNHLDINTLTRQSMSDQLDQIVAQFNTFYSAQHDALTAEANRIHTRLDTIGNARERAQQAQARLDALTRQQSDEKSAWISNQTDQLVNNATSDDPTDFNEDAFNAEREAAMQEIEARYAPQIQTAQEEHRQADQNQLEQLELIEKRHAIGTNLTLINDAKSSLESSLDGHRNTLLPLASFVEKKRENEARLAQLR